MGTSQSHGSPHSAAWNLVRDLYASGASPPDLASAIADAVPEATLALVTSEHLCGLADRVSEASRSNLRSPEVALTEADHPGHSIAASLARAAAVRALLLLHGVGVEVDDYQVARTYASEYLAALFEYLVERDIYDYVGTQPFPTVADATALSQSVASLARDAVLAQDPQSSEAPAAASAATAVATLMLGAFAALKGSRSRGA